jgi:hypothetical protein
MNISIPAQTDNRRTFFVIGVMTMGIALLIIDSMQKKGWVSAAWWGYSLSAAFFVYAFATKDELMKKFFLFSLVAGFAELPADNWLVMYTKTLVYPPSPMILRSPAYMPFSWTVVLIEVGYIGWLVSNRFGILKASVFLCAFSALLIPLYEKWAVHAKWWHYENTDMFLGVPLYIILAEGLLMMTVPFILSKVQHAKPGMIVLWGLAEGLVMWLACIIAYAVLG